MSTDSQADYGQDAPKVVRNLVVAAAIALLVWGSIRGGLWSGRPAISLRGARVIIDVSSMAVGVFLLCSLTAAVMVWESRIGKMRSRERLLANVEWTGTEQVLDIGCGRGLLLIGAAKHLTSGKAVGIDIWQTEDLSGNRPEATLANAHIEGVEGRIKLETADMRCLPFPDGTFDVVLSRTAIHNVYASGDRAKVIGEVTRVMKPGGRAIIEDIRYGRDYARLFAQLGCTDIQHLGSRLRALFATLLTFGSVRPVTLLIKKAS